jgi:hypothetical protein
MSGHRGPANALVSANATAHAIAAARVNVSARVNVNGPPLPALKSGGRGLNPCIPCKTAYIRASGHCGPANATVHVYALVHVPVSVRAHVLVDAIVAACAAANANVLVSVTATVGALPQRGAPFKGVEHALDFSRPDLSVGIPHDPLLLLHIFRIHSAGFGACAFFPLCDRSNRRSSEYPN